jgi:hypothetical protein
MTVYRVQWGERTPESIVLTGPLARVLDSLKKRKTKKAKQLVSDMDRAICTFATAYDVCGQKLKKIDCST